MSAPFSAAIHRGPLVRLLCASPIVVLMSLGAASGARAQDRTEPLTAPDSSQGAPGAARVRFVSDQRATIHVQRGTTEVTFRAGLARVRRREPVYERLCTAPCELQLEPGAHRLALSLGEHDPLPAPGALDLEGPGTLRGSYVDHSMLRTSGWAIFTGGLVGGAVAITAAIITRGSAAFGPLLTTGIVSVVSALCAGIPMALTGDGVVLRFQ